ncbi:MAG: single-stranded-DNA-specific exonuclease RecJ [Bacteroidales bacterium]
MKEKRWIVLPPANKEIALKLAQLLNVELPIAQLLAQRGITSFEEAKAFFRPQMSDLLNPFAMKDMDKAVARLEEAVAKNQKILVYGDYDVDGTTAVALVYSFLKSQNIPALYFIPERYLDGYGISIRGIDYAVNEGASLIIALDCGIKAVDKVAYAKSKGIDFIICDHHLPDNQIPNAVAVLDPQRTDCEYPYKELSGCGVGYKFLQAYCLQNHISTKLLEPLLDLVAVSIASDIVPLTGENRILAYYGLQRINTEPRKGFQAIMRRSGLDDEQPINIDDIVFRIGPRINAAGRMESGVAAVDLLTAETDDVANTVGDLINDHNNDRKNVDRSITLEAINIIEQDPQLQMKNTTVLYNPDWHKGVVGIVASRLVENFYRPSIVLTESNGLVTGSARSIPGFDLYQAIEACADLLVTFGGHMYAAGLSMKAENVEPFINRFEEIASRVIEPSMLIPQVEIDQELYFRDITPKFWRILQQFRPFGPGNMSPVFVSRKVYSSGNARIVGVDSEHLKLELIQEDCPYQPMSAIAFNQAHLFKHINKGVPVDICYTITENNFRGRSSLQLRIKDIKKRN